MEYLMPSIIAIVLTLLILVFSFFITKMRTYHHDEISNEIMNLLGNINDSNSDIHNQFIRTKKRAAKLSEITKEVVDIKQDIKRIENDMEDINKSIEDLKHKINKRRG